MQKMRFFRRGLPLFLAFWLLLAVAGAPFAAYAGESVTVRDSSGQVRYAAPMDPENACPALQSALSCQPRREIFPFPIFGSRP